MLLTSSSSSSEVHASSDSVDARYAAAVAAPASPELDELEHVDAAERGRGGFPSASLGLPKRLEWSETRALAELLSLGLPHILAGELESRVAPGTGGGGSGGRVFGGGTRGVG